MINDRKAFNFYRSYYEVAKTLPKRDQLSFIMAILDKQFCNIEPNLSGKSLNAYIGQKHSIEAQIAGFIAKNMKQTSLPPSVPPTQPPSVPPSIQGEEEGKGEEEVQFVIWGESIVKNNDHVWSQMRVRNITQDEMDIFISVAIRNGWKIKTQHEFRLALKGFKNTSDNKKQIATNYKVQ